MTRPENMTEAHLKAVFDAMPEEMSEGELCALTLTTYTTYMDKPSEILKNLIITTASYAMSQGLTRVLVAEMFAEAAVTYLPTRSAETEH